MCAALSCNLLRESGQAVYAGCILKSAVFDEALFAFSNSPAVEGISICPKVHEGNRKSTGSGDAGHLNMNEGAPARIRWKQGGQLRKTWFVWKQHRTLSMQSHNIGFALERAEHHHNT